MKSNEILLRDVGKLIQKLRKERKMSGIDLGVEIGVSQQKISRYEKGYSEISITNLFNILIVFNMTPTELFSLMCDAEHKPESIEKYFTITY